MRALPGGPPDIPPTQLSDAGKRAQIRQLTKEALEVTTPDSVEQFLTFATKFRRLAVWNARMAYIQRPGARVIASEFEWNRVGRLVLPDAVPIIILWPFSPIRFVYELADTGPDIDREQLNDPFAVKGELRANALSTLEAKLKKQRTFRVEVERRRQGFDRAGSATSQTPAAPLKSLPALDASSTGALAHKHADTRQSSGKRLTSFRIVLNDALEAEEQFVTMAHELGHIFCGHLGGCAGLGRQDDESGWPDRRFIGIHAQEIEAEAAAFIVAGRAGLIPRSAEYLKHHAQEVDISAIDEDLIVRAASRIERLADLHYGTMSFKNSPSSHR